MKKKILFIGVTEYNLNSDNPHLQKKFEGLSEEVEVFLIARGRPLYKSAYHSTFYLIPHRLIYVPVAFFLGCYMCIIKKVDVIICQGPLTEGLIGVALKFLWRKELIIEIHGDWREGPFINKKRFFAGFLKKITPLIAGLSFRSANKVRAVAEYFARELRGRYPDKKYFIFPTYSDLDLFFMENSEVNFKKYICTVAVLSPIKSINTLIESFYKVHAQFADFKLVIVGDGPSMGALKVQVKNLGIGDGVIFTGKLSTSEARDIIKDCFVFVLPSLSEGLPRVIIEAMALRKPIIASRVGGIPEIVHEGETGFLIEPENPQSLTEKLLILLNDPERAGAMGDEGHKFARENFSNEKYISNYISMIYS